MAVIYTLSGERLREYAQEQGLDISMLQHKAGLPLEQVQSWWQNEASEVADNVLEKLAGALRVNPGELIILPTDKFVSQEEDIEWIAPRQQKKSSARRKNKDIRTDRFTWQEGDLEFEA